MQLEYFRLIDRIVAIDIDAGTIQVEANVPATSTIFEGHFPGHPLMPGVLLLEAMAQASGWLVIGVTQFQRMPFLAAFKDAKLRSFVSPGMRLMVTATLVHQGSGFAVTRAEIRERDTLACNAEMTFRLADFPNQTFRDSMLKIAAEIAFPMKASAHG
jgi:3-hydroxyacyl-[acyl-carrier-protein] dehydratase